MITKTITLSSVDWLHISSSETKDDNGFIFWSNGDLLFSTVSQPGATEQIPLGRDKMFGFAKQQDFYVKGSIGVEIYLAPFDGVLGGGGSTNDKGFFLTEAALNLAYPVGVAGRFATVGSTDTIRTRDSDTNNWVDTHIVPPIPNQLSKSNELLINTADPEVTGKQYQSVANANTYLESIPATTPRAIGLAGVYTPDIEAIDYGDIFGDGAENTILGNVSLKTATAVQNNFYDCTIGKLFMKDISSGGGAITYSTEVTQLYAPAISTYSTDGMTPTSGTYSISVEGSMPSVVQRDATALDIENIIHAINPVYILATVTGDLASGFTITRNGIKSGGVSIAVTNIDLSPFPGSSFATFVGKPHPTMTDITITADNAGSVGNCLITSTGLNTVAQRITMWNISNPSQTVTLTAGDGTQDRPSSDAELTGGVDGGFNVSNKAGITEQQTLTFSGVPSSGQRMLSYLYNSITYYSSVLAFDADYTAVETAIRDIFQQIQNAESIDLGASAVTVIGDYSTGFVFELSKYPGEAEELISVATSVLGTYANFTGTLLSGGIPTPVFNVVADIAGSAGNSVSLSFSGIPQLVSIQEAIDNWNIANPTNTITPDYLTFPGTGAMLPDNKQKFTLSGGQDAYTYNLEGGGTTVGQVAGLKDVKLLDFAVTGGKSMLSMKGGGIDGGIFLGMQYFYAVDVDITGGTFGSDGNARGGSVSLEGIIIASGGFNINGAVLYGNLPLTETLTLKNTIDGTITIKAGATLNTYECINLTVINNGGTWNDYSKNIIVSGDPISGLITPLVLANGYPQVCYDTVGHHMYRATGTNPGDRILI